MVQIIAHRGASSIAPENTIAAAEKAWQAGADLWETDIAVTRNEHLILLHDDSLERTTNVRKIFPNTDSFQCSSFTLEQIQTLDTGSRYVQTDPFEQIRKGVVTSRDISDFLGEKVPTLEQALLFTQQKNWKINLELKKLSGRFKDFPVPEKVVELIRKIRIDPGQVIVSSFCHKWLTWVHEMEPEIEIQALIGFSDDQPLDWGNFFFDVYNANSSLIDQEQIQRVKVQKKKINLFTVNGIHDMKKFKEMGVDGLITDFPQCLKPLAGKDNHETCK